MSRLARARSSQYRACITRRGLSILAAAVFALICCGSELRAQEDPSATARQILESGGYQQSLPGFEFRDWEQLPPWRREIGSRDPGLSSSIDPRGGGFGVLAWIAVGVVVMVIVLKFIGAARGANADVRIEDDESAAESDALPVLTERPIAEANRLAADGRFGEAIRVLLECTFAALREAGRVGAEPWLTAREVMASARLSQRAVARLGDLVQRVELSLFARRDPGREEYEDCVSCYRALLRVARKGAASK